MSVPGAAFCAWRSGQSDQRRVGSGEEVLIQGIIDAYFYEDREIVLPDDKTDYVPGGDPGVLIDRYRMQMDCYQMALERLAGVRVKREMDLFLWAWTGDTIVKHA